MELCPGGDLEKLIDKVVASGKVFSEFFVTDIMTKIVLALMHLRGNRIVHRDLKPSNIVFKDLSHTELRLIDFGVTRIFGQKTDSFGQFTVCGTFGYMAPEVLADQSGDESSGREYSYPVDVFAFGVIAYQL